MKNFISIISIFMAFSSCLAQPHEPADPSDAGVDYNSPVLRKLELDPSFQVAGYLPMGLTGRLDPQKLSYISDVIYFSVSPKADGSFSLPDPKKQAYVESLSRDYGVKVHLALTDHTSRGKTGPMALLTRSGEKRKKLAEELGEFLHQKGYAGAVFDWEYPWIYRDKANYVLLLKELKASFKAHGLSLGIAVSPWHVLEKEAYQVVDRIHLMTYDDYGRHSTYTGTKIHLQKMIRIYGAPPEKILLGLPFYGRGYAAGKKWNQAKTYRALAQSFNPKPSEDSAGGFYFNGPKTIQDKVRLARDYKLAGVMVWEITQDAWGDRSLLRAIAQVQNEYLPFWGL